MFFHSNEVELGRSELFEELKEWLAAKTDHKEDAKILAIAELIQEMLDTMDATDAFKGGIVSSLIVDLSEQNKVYLAIHRMLRESLMDRKPKTIH